VCGSSEARRRYAKDGDTKYWHSDQRRHGTDKSPGKVGIKIAKKFAEKAGAVRVIDTQDKLLKAIAFSGLAMCEELAASMKRD
jgi:hypothetical protein